jgi:hypothetical protein
MACTSLIPKMQKCTKQKTLSSHQCPQILIRAKFSYIPRIATTPISLQTRTNRLSRRTGLVNARSLPPWIRPSETNRGWLSRQARLEGRRARTSREDAASAGHLGAWGNGGGTRAGRAPPSAWEGSRCCCGGGGHGSWASELSSALLKRIEIAFFFPTWTKETPRSTRQRGGLPRLNRGPRRARFASGPRNRERAPRASSKIVLLGSKILGHFLEIKVCQSTFWLLISFKLYFSNIGAFGKVFESRFRLLISLF